PGRVLTTTSGFLDPPSSTADHLMKCRTVDPLYCPPAGHRPCDEQQDHRADEGYDGAADPPAIRVSKHRLEQEASHQGTHQADDQVADHPAGPFARNDHFGQRAGNDPHYDPKQDMHCFSSVIRSPSTRLGRRPPTSFHIPGLTPAGPLF